MIVLKVLINANMNMYADDHQFYANGSTLTDVHDDLVVCAELASSWYRANKGLKLGQIPDKLWHLVAERSLL